MEENENVKRVFTLMERGLLEDENALMREELQMLRAVEAILNEREDEMLWEPCDCGCPSKSSPRTRGAVLIIPILRHLKTMPRVEIIIDGETHNVEVTGASPQGAASGGL